MAAFSFAEIRALMSFGMAIEAMIAMMATTIINSISVKPEFLLVFMVPQVVCPLPSVPPVDSPGRWSVVRTSPEGLPHPAIAARTYRPRLSGVLSAPEHCRNVTADSERKNFRSAALQRVALGPPASGRPLVGWAPAQRSA